jgi:hypothetical protein
MLHSLSILMLAMPAPEQATTDGGENIRQPTVTETVAVAAVAISEAVRAYAQAEDSGFRVFISKDESIIVYTDFSKSEGKRFMQAIETMRDRMDHAFGPKPDLPATEEVLSDLREPGFEEPRATAPLIAFLIIDPAHYHGLLDTVAAAAPDQRNFMARSRNTTGFTLFAPELTAYFHDINVQEEAMPDRSLAHNLVHLELNRRYGTLPLWVREGIATAVEDMCWGEVWGPWYLNGFVFTSSHGDWRGKGTQELVEGLEGGIDRLYTYKANPYDDDLAHLSFAFATYAMLEESEGFQAFLAGLQELYTEINTEGGMPAFSREQVDEVFDANFEAGFLERMQEWWDKPPRWNKKPKKKR